MRVRPMAFPRSASRRGHGHRPFARRLVVSLLLPLLTVAGGALFAPGVAVAAPAAVPSLSIALAPTADGPCTSSDPVVCAIREMTPEERAEAREVRMRYHELLDHMGQVEQQMRDEGRSDEEIARVLVNMRNEAKDITRAGMSPDAVALLEARNMVKYGNPLGPTADQQFAKYGSWDKVIDAATRSSAAVDQELGLEPRR
ncbi:hypothetical protein ACFT7S_06705 [Streptomyces sp. NPDC057136]|uniref:hypothetical protein n=1 Tax=Streptomyces sp. NPDC057136 TaxID=3346029 RepID=UPI003638348E